MPPVGSRWPDESKRHSLDQKIAVSSEYSDLPEVVPESLAPGPSHTPLVSPLTPSVTGSPAFVAGRPKPPTPWSPVSFESLNPRPLTPHGFGAPPPYIPSAPPSPAPSHQSLAPLYPQGPPPGPFYFEPPRPRSAHPSTMNGGYGRDPGYPPPGPMGGVPVGLGPVATARKRRRLLIKIWLCVCALFLILVVGVVVGIFFGYIRVKYHDGKNNPSRRQVIPSRRMVFEGAY